MKRRRRDIGQIPGQNRHDRPENGRTQTRLRHNRLHIPGNRRGNCIPSGIVGILFKDYIEKYLSSILTVALSLLFTSIILFILSKLTKNNKNEEKLNVKKSISIGLSQIIGLIPGISRSGITTFMGVNKKLSLEEALKFSFIMYLPTSIGATFLSLISDNSIIESFNYLYIVSFISSFIGTYLGISLFFISIKKNNFKFFAIYLLIISTIILFII